MSAQNTAPTDKGNLLEVEALQVYYLMSREKIVKAVDGVTFSLGYGDALGIVGESGSGKSTLARAILQVVDQPGKIVGGEIYFRNQNLLSLPEHEMRQIRGKEISIVFQDPTTSLDNFFTFGDQLLETLNTHEELSQEEALARTAEALGMVGITDVDQVLRAYPSEYSAGFRQRIMITMAMICRPYLVIADEPTTTLGATVQAQVLDSLHDIRQEMGAAVIFITHDIGVVSQFSSDIMVMYAGKCVEYGPKEQLLLHPRHPYTVGLIRSVPLIEARRTKRLKSIPGFPPDMLNLPPGCPFAPRCEHAQSKCRTEMPDLVSDNGEHAYACYFPVDFDTREELILGSVA